MNAKMNDEPENTQLQGSIEALLQRFVGKKFTQEAYEEIVDEVELLALLHSPPTKRTD